MPGAKLGGALLVDAWLLKANLEETWLYQANLSGAKLHLAKNLTKAQLLSARCLYQTKGIDQWKAELEKEKPCLFTEEGCPVE